MKLNNKKPAENNSRPGNVIHLKKYSTSISIICQNEVEYKIKLLLAKCKQLNHSSIPEFIKVGGRCG